MSFHNIVTFNGDWKASESYVSLEKDINNRINFYEDGRIKLIGNISAKEMGAFLAQLILDGQLNISDKSYITISGVFNIALSNKNTTILKWVHKSKPPNHWREFLNGYNSYFKLKAFI